MYSQLCGKICSFHSCIVEDLSGVWLFVTGLAFPDVPFKHAGVLIHWKHNILEDLCLEKMLVVIVNVEITDMEFSLIKRFF